jgi:hypothetical protein
MKMCFLHRMELFSLHLLVVLPNKLSLPQVRSYSLIYFFLPHFLLHMSLCSIRVVPLSQLLSSLLLMSLLLWVNHFYMSLPSLHLVSCLLLRLVTPHPLIWLLHLTLLQIAFHMSHSYLHPVMLLHNWMPFCLHSLLLVLHLSLPEMSLSQPQQLESSQGHKQVPSSLKPFLTTIFTIPLNIILRLYILWLYLLNHLAIQWLFLIHIGGLLWGLNLMHLCPRALGHFAPQPLHKNVIRNKWVFKLKTKADGTIDWYKACLVAKGFDQ